MRHASGPVHAASLALTVLVLGGAVARAAEAPTSPQQAVFEQNCAICHNNPATRAPSVATLHAMAPSFIVQALTDGVMQGPGGALSPAQRVALAEYLTGRKLADEHPMAGACAGKPPALALDGPSYNGWGNGLANWRYQADPGIAPGDLTRLKVRWAFGYPGAVAAFGQPTLAGGRVFVGSQNGHVYALDAKTGCYDWDYRAGTGVRAAVTVARVGGRDLALFGDRRAHVYAVDVATGKTVWKVLADDGPRVQVTGAPALFEGRLYVPISGGDDSAAVDPKYECCKGRGAVVALDATTGATIWTTYTIDDARPTTKNAIGTQLWGPSGVSVWASPTVDAKRRVLYVGTGDNHSAPVTGTSDAMLALSLDGGKILWVRQLLAGDMGNGACFAEDKTNCPQPHGPDFDLGASPNLVTLDGGKQLLIVGQKSGMLWALDPDDSGRIVWSRRVAAGGTLGGVQWGTATDGKTAYVAVSDLGFLGQPVLGRPLVLDPNKGGGLLAVRVATGDPVWTAAPVLACGARPNCSPAQSAAVTATPDYVLSGAVDGHMRAYATQTGKVIWDLDTTKSFPTVNQVAASGGSIDAGGATVAGGMMFVSSGYGLYGGQPGNVLLALAPSP